MEFVLLGGIDMELGTQHYTTPKRKMHNSSIYDSRNYLAKKKFDTARSI